MPRNLFTVRRVWSQTREIVPAAIHFSSLFSFSVIFVSSYIRARISRLRGAGTINKKEDKARNVNFRELESSFSAKSTFLMRSNANAMKIGAKTPFPLSGFRAARCKKTLQKWRPDKVETARYIFREILRVEIFALIRCAFQIERIHYSQSISFRFTLLCACLFDFPLTFSCLLFVSLAVRAAELISS